MGGDSLTNNHTYDGFAGIPSPNNHGNLLANGRAVEPKGVSVDEQPMSVEGTACKCGCVPCDVNDVLEKLSAKLDRVSHTVSRIDRTQHGILHKIGRRMSYSRFFIDRV